MVSDPVVVAPSGFKPCFYMPEGSMASAWKIQVEEKSFSLRFTSLLSLSARFRRLLSWISLSLGLA
jgi:hypothetical protein